MRSTRFTQPNRAIACDWRTHAVRPKQINLPIRPKIFAAVEFFADRAAETDAAWCETAGKGKNRRKKPVDRPAKANLASINLNRDRFFEGRSIEGQRWSGYAKYPSLTNFVPDDVDQLYDSVIQAVGDGHFRSHLLKPKPPRNFTKNCRFLAGRAQLRRIGFGMRNA